MSERRLIKDGPSICACSSEQKAIEQGRHALNNPASRGAADGFIVHQESRSGDDEPLFHVYLAKWL